MQGGGRRVQVGWDSKGFLAYLAVVFADFAVKGS
jgi:hypothetical protein